MCRVPVALAIAAVVIVGAIRLVVWRNGDIAWRNGDIAPRSDYVGWSGRLTALAGMWDALSIILLTAVHAHGVITNLGYDPIRFGVLMVSVIEIGLITPPMDLLSQMH